jgi:hypothetical protein
MKLGELHKDTMEQDLWDLGEDDDVFPEDAAAALPKPEQPVLKLPITTREISAKKHPDNTPVKPAKVMAVKAKAPSPRTFDDLDGEASPPPPAPRPVAPPEDRPVVIPEDEPEPSPLEPSPLVEDDEDEFNPHASADAKPVSLRPTLGLSKLERIGLIGLVVVIVAGGIWFLTQSLGGLPRESALNQKPEFPVKGGLVTLADVKTYWREPVEQGENADTVRRGTELLPVAEVKLDGGPAAIRIFFRNADGEVVGDPVTRSFAGKSTIAIPATAGFDDKGMHSAYRTGLSKPWTIEIFEAPSIDAPSEAFRKILKMTISPDRQ